MTPESGWYPDPTGTAQFRFWDGQTWTTATASPAAPTLPGSDQSAFAPSGYGETASPYRGPQSVLPQDGYFGSPQRPKAVVGSTGFAKQRRSKTFYGLIAGIAAAAVAVAAIIPLTLGGKSSESSKPGSIHLPSSFNGWQRLTGSQIDSVSRSLKQAWPLKTPVVIGAYGQDAGSPNAVAFVGTTNVTPAGLAAVQRGIEQGLSSNNLPVIFTTVDPGPYGGFLRCGMASKPGRGSMAMCFFGDLYVAGVVATIGSDGASVESAVQLRYAVETAPAT